MLDTTWERVEVPQNAVIWHLTYIPSQEAFQTRQMALNSKVRLPYTATMLTRRQERGGDVPANWKPQVFTIADAGAEPESERRIA